MADVRPFYDHPVTTYEAPRLHEQCQQVPDTDGSTAEHCTYTWTLTDGAVPAGG